MFNFYKIKYKKGVSLIEVVIASAIIGSVSVSVFGGLGLMTQYAVRNTSFVKASMLAEEGIEALRQMRDFGYASNILNLTPGSTYRFAWDGSKWVSTTAVNFFDRTFVLSNVNRDMDFDIVSSGGTLDSGTKKVTVTVSFKEGVATTSRSIEGYIFNTFNN